MTSASLNLSTRPFVNRRPVVRLALVLWVAGLVLLAGNVWLYWDFLVGRGDVHARLRQVAEEIAVEETRVAALSQELSTFDLADQNEQVAYLNDRIERRRFSWSRLFDELADLLPRDVRLQTLTPSSGDSTRGRGRSRVLGGVVTGDRVVLRIEGQARTDEAILELVDALFADPDFDRPNLLQQAEIEGGLIRFDLEAIYTPRSTEEPEVLPLEPAPESESEDGEGAPAGAGGARPSSTAGPVRLGRPASSPPELS